jgi:hypothetical protein
MANHEPSNLRNDDDIQIHSADGEESGEGCVDVITFALQERQCFHTIGDNMDLARTSRVAKSRESYVNIRRISCVPSTAAGGTNSFLATTSSQILTADCRRVKCARSIE